MCSPPASFALALPSPCPRPATALIPPAPHCTLPRTRTRPLSRSRCRCSPPAASSLAALPAPSWPFPSPISNPPPPSHHEPPRPLNPISPPSQLVLYTPTISRSTYPPFSHFFHLQAQHGQGALRARLSPTLPPSFLHPLSLCHRITDPPSPSSLPSIDDQQVLAILYSGGQFAKEQPKLLGTTENKLGFEQWLTSQGHELIVSVLSLAVFLSLAQGLARCLGKFAMLRRLDLPIIKAVTRASGIPGVEEHLSSRCLVQR